MNGTILRRIIYALMIIPVATTSSAILPASNLNSYVPSMSRMENVSAGNQGINYTPWGRNVTIDAPLWATIDTNESNFPSGYYTPGSKIEIRFQSFNYDHTNDTMLSFSLVEEKPNNRTVIEETEYIHTWLYNVSWSLILPHDSPAQYALNITARSLPGDDYIGSIRSIIIVPGQEIEGSIELTIKPGPQPTYNLTLRNTGENVWEFNPYGYQLEEWRVSGWNRVDLGGVPIPLMVMPPGNYSEKIHLPVLVGRYRVSMDISAEGVKSGRTLYYEFSVGGNSVSGSGGQEKGINFFSFGFAAVLIFASLWVFERESRRS